MGGYHVSGGSDVAASDVAKRSDPTRGSSERQSSDESIGSDVSARDSAAGIDHTIGAELAAYHVDSFQPARENTSGSVDRRGGGNITSEVVECSIVGGQESSHGGIAVVRGSRARSEGLTVGPIVGRSEHAS